MIKSVPRIGQVRFLVGVALSIALLSGCSSNPQPPYLNKYLVKASPAGTYEATFYDYGKGGGSGFLGATVTTPAYVNVRRRNEPFDPEKGQVFAMSHGYRLRLTWQDEQHLRIDYPSTARVERTQAQSSAVSILFYPVPQNQLPEPYNALPAATAAATSTPGPPPVP